MSNNIDQKDFKSAASNYTVVSMPDSHDTNATLPHDTTVFAEDKATSKPPTSPSDTEMPQDRHVPAVQPLSLSKSLSSSSTPPLQQALTMSSPQPQLSSPPPPLPSIPLHVKRDMQHMRRASTSPKEMFQFFPQVPVE